MMLLVDAIGAAAAAPKLNNPCLDASKPYQKMKWCDATLPIDERVQDMISRMSLAEKIDALDTVEKSIDSLGLVPYNWWSEATHGISHVSNGDKTPYESNFAFPITTAMSFNRTLYASQGSSPSLADVKIDLPLTHASPAWHRWKKTGAQIGREARAFMNQGDAWSTYWAPVINLAREPRWGRNIETPGEDPYLSGEYATAFVSGFEVSEDDPSGLQASACCKHYVANSMDHSTVAGETFDRTTFNANITMQDLVDSYLLPFQARHPCPCTLPLPNASPLPLHPAPAPCPCTVPLHCAPHLLSPSPALLLAPLPRDTQRAAPHHLQAPSSGRALRTASTRPPASLCAGLRGEGQGLGPHVLVQRGQP